MILKCNCINSTADSLHGNGLRPHSALVKFRDRPGALQKAGGNPEFEEYCCDYCCYTRSKATGLATGAKTGTVREVRMAQAEDRGLSE